MASLLSTPIWQHVKTLDVSRRTCPRDRLSLVDEGVKKNNNVKMEISLLFC